jgi:hypothetical protein
MSRIWKISFAVLALLATRIVVSQDVAAPESPAENTLPEGVEVIVVSGGKTKVPLWQVSNGEHTLYVLGYIGSIPKDVEWDYSELQQVIDVSQEFISEPDIVGGVSPLLFLNPINIVRGLRLIKRLQNNPDKQTLADVLPPELYQRYAELKATYFPQAKDIDQRRPIFAGSEIPGLIFEGGNFSAEETAVDSIGPMLEQVGKMVRRNRKMKKTDPKAEIEIKGRYGVLADRVETMVDTIPTDLALACFESGLDFPETHRQNVLDTQRRARAWIINDVDTLEALGDGPGGGPCDAALRGTTEGAMMATLEQEARQRWLTATEQALMNNASTFAILPLFQMVGDEGLLLELEAKGYVVTPPPEV